MSSLTFAPPQKQHADAKPKRQPPYNVILWDDDHHTFGYVIRMLRELFAQPLEQARQLAEAVDNNGSVICLTTTKEHAELKQDQVHSYGKDAGVMDCSGAMSCSIEPVD